MKNPIDKLKKVADATAKVGSLKDSVLLPDQYAALVIVALIAAVAFTPVTVEDCVQVVTLIGLITTAISPWIPKLLKWLNAVQRELDERREQAVKVQEIINPHLDANHQLKVDSDIGPVTQAAIQELAETATDAQSGYDKKGITPPLVPKRPAPFPIPAPKKRKPTKPAYWGKR